MKLVISGRRIINCMEIQAPKENPPIQHSGELGLWACIQSNAEAASESSPRPLSKVAWERPTPRKLKRSVEKPRRTNI